MLDCERMALTCACSDRKVRLSPVGAAEAATTSHVGSRLPALLRTLRAFAEGIA